MQNICKTPVSFYWKMKMEKKNFEKIDLPSVKNIIVIASGKGGVGKSTVAANLSVSLAREGFSVALVDADLYGPSIPTMFGVQNEKPKWIDVDGKQKIIPILKYGIKLVSIGFFCDTKQSLMWRGPMVSNGISQLVGDTLWEDVDYMIIDFPPGTGDIQLTIVQRLAVSGAIIVTTPQEVAVSDARKAADMFVSPHIKVPLFGIVENMSWFTPALHPEERYFIFGKNGGAKLAGEFKVPMLSQIPMVIEIGENADQGLSVYQQNNKAVIDAFEILVHALVERIKGADNQL